MNRLVTWIFYLAIGLAGAAGVAHGQGSSWTNSNAGDLLTNANWDTPTAPNGVGALASEQANENTIFLWEDQLHKTPNLSQPALATIYTALSMPPQQHKSIFLSLATSIQNKYFS